MGASSIATYVEWRASAPLTRYVDCTFKSTPSTGGARPTEPILPDGCMDIIWDGARLSLSGPDTRPVWSASAPSTVVGLRFRPGIASLFLGVPAETVRDRRVELGELWSDADQIADVLASCSDPARCARELIAAVQRRLPDIASPDPLVEAAVRVWAVNAEALSTAELAERAGITPRQAHRRFLTAVGYGPKLLQRALRFQRFLRSCRDRQAGLAELALRCGFADQAHLNREARLLAGVTPTQLRDARRHVRNVQEALVAQGVDRSYDADTDEDAAA